MNIKNEVTFNYVYDNKEGAMLPVVCEVDKVYNRPNLQMSKSADKKQAEVGDIITFTLDMIVGDGDDVYSSQWFEDVHTDDIEFIEGTLLLDGVPMENQSIDHIDVNFGVNETHTIEYQCRVLY